MFDVSQYCLNRDCSYRGEKHLLKIVDLIREHNKDENKVKIREPEFLSVITAGETAYTLKSGVKIIPIGCLRD